MKNFKKKIIIGLALSMPLNNTVSLTLVRLFNLIHFFLRIEIIICLPNSQNITDFSYKYINYIDDNSLFDFSRYYCIANLPEVNDNDILFMFNDTLGNGRKVNTGLFLFILFAICCLNFEILRKYQLYSPVDSDEYGMWISPYFLISNAYYIRKLNFNNWKFARNKTQRTIRKKLISWLYRGWRNSTTSSLLTKRRKYKTLLLERNLLSQNEIKYNVCKFSKYNLFRIINSIEL
jgi:hypothetical protein